MRENFNDVSGGNVYIKGWYEYDLDQLAQECGYDDFHDASRQALITGGAMNQVVNPLVGKSDKEILAEVLKCPERMLLAAIAVNADNYRMYTDGLGQSVHIKGWMEYNLDELARRAGFKDAEDGAIYAVQHDEQVYKVLNPYSGLGYKELLQGALAKPEDLFLISLAVQ